MEIKARVPCEMCKGTGVKRGGEQPLLCLECQDGFVYSWVDINELPMLQIEKTRKVKVPH